MKKTLNHIMLITTLIMGTIHSPSQIISHSPKHEMRAVWLTTLNGLDWPSRTASSHNGIEQQKQELRNILDRLSAANFNTVILQTRIRATVIYPSQIEPWDACFSGRVNVSPGYDPLKFAIEECHKRGMQLHAWVVAIPGEKLAHSRSMGSTALEKRVPHLCLKTSESYMLDPGVPQTADYLASICQEIVQGYDVDGISLDYIRYPEKEIRYNDAATYRRHAQNGQDIAQWRRENINRCVSAISKKIKALKPWIIFSASPIGKYDDTQRYPSGGWNAYNAVYQDAKRWLTEGWMDMLMPMMYFRDNNFFPFALDWQQQTPTLSVVPGLAAYMVDPRQKDWPLSVIESEIHFSRMHNLGGQAFFRSRFITNNTKGIYNLLKDNIYYSPALVPPVVAHNTPAPPTPTSGQINEQANSITLKWSQIEGCRYVLYRSSTYPVDTSNTDCIFIPYLQTPFYTINAPIPTNWLPYYAVTAINRYGAESAPLQLNTPQPTKQIDKTIFHTMGK